VTELSAGRHELELRFEAADLHPGSGGRVEPAGPLVLSRAEPGDARLLRLPADRAQELCGRRLDWVEATG
jgi:hypothetical protein